MTKAEKDRAQALVHRLSVIIGELEEWVAERDSDFEDHSQRWQESAAGDDFTEITANIEQAKDDAQHAAEQLETML